MRAPILLLLFLSLPALAFSENATAENSTLPPMPQADGLLALQAVLVNGSPSVGMPLLITATKSGSSTPTIYRLITGREGNVLLTLGRGDYQLDCVLDDMATSGADYAATASLSMPGEQNRSLVFYPAGSAAVTALENNQVVPGASMHVSCASEWFDYGVMNGASAQAGQAGDFIFRALPAGTCVISASTQTSAGSAQVIVEQGKLLTTQVELKPKALAFTDIALALGAVAALAAILSYQFFFAGKKQPAQAAHEIVAEKKAPAAKSRKQKARARPAHAPAQHASARAAAPHQKASAFDVNGERARAVLGTLSEREADIVRFLMSAGGKSKRSTMQHKLLIPKTSLLRNLRALERKNIVKLIPFGRNLVAELVRELFE